MIEGELLVLADTVHEYMYDIYIYIYIHVYKPTSIAKHTILSSLMEFMKVTRVSAAPGMYVSNTRAAIRLPCEVRQKQSEVDMHNDYDEQ